MQSTQYKTLVIYRHHFELFGELLCYYVTLSNNSRLMNITSSPFICLSFVGFIIAHLPSHAFLFLMRLIWAFHLHFVGFKIREICSRIMNIITPCCHWVNVWVVHNSKNCYWWETIFDFNLTENLYGHLTSFT